MGNEVGLIDAWYSNCLIEAVKFPSPMGNEVGLIMERRYSYGL